MGFKFVAAGSALRDQIILYGEDTVSSSQIGGGGVYAATGLRMWEESVALAVYTGPDFNEHFDPWLKKVDIDASGSIYKFEHCRFVELRYNEHGTFGVTDRWPEHNVPHCDKIDLPLLRPLIGSDTVGVHILGRLLPDVAAEIHDYCRQNGTLFSSELEPLRWVGQDGLYELLREYVSHTDMFSLNFYEVQQLFPEVRDYKDAVELLQSFEKPCYFRVGTDGAYLLINGEEVYQPMIDHFGSIDPTGCGNTSTAAVFWAMTKGYDPKTMAVIGAVTASYNASFKGLITDTSPAARARCLKVVEKYIKEHKG